tara:strand:+ start:3998 stop:5779 length:1782 start_codon:yes stop_codon:yes gene_type:complete
MSKYRMIYFFLREYYRLIICIVISSIGFAVFESFNVAAIFPVVNSIFAKPDHVGNYGKIIHIILNMVNSIPAENLFVSSCLFLIFAAIIKSGFLFSYIYFSNKLSQIARRNLQDRIFRKFIYSDYQFFLDHKQGTLIYRLLDASVNVGTVLKLVPDIFIQSLKIIFLIILLFSISIKIACGMLTVGVIFGIIIKKLSGRSYSFGQEVTQSLSDERTVANESITGIKQILIYSNQAMWISRFRTKLQTYYKYKLKSLLLHSIPTVTLEPTILSAIAAAAIVIYLKDKNNFINMLPMLMVYAFAIIRINPSLTIIGQHRMLVMNVLPDIELCFSALSEKTINIEDGHKEFEAFNKEIIFNEVSFAYPKRDTIFEDLSFKIEKGQVTAIVGTSGVGKSTLMDLLVRLFDQDKGNIIIDGTELNELRISSWRSKIGYVSQEPFIFHSTIAENIAFQKNKYSINEIIHAAKAANAHEFISSFPEGYQTIVGDRGMKLSGGQKQRVAIARAVIRKPELIIFDEATSSLDSISEKLVQQSINLIAQKYTIIIIAHRLSTVKNADKILLLREKGIVEQGNHSELMNLKGYYWELYSQSVLQ